MTVLKHYRGTEYPTPDKVRVGELVLRLDGNIAELYTKDFNGRILPIGRGVSKFIELEDLDLTNLKEDSFIVRQGDKFVAINQIGSINNLTDVEISNVQSGDYLRYDSTFQAFRNFKPSYNLFELLDVDIIPSTSTQSSQQNNHVLYYNHESGKFKTRPRTNILNELADVEVTFPDTPQILTLDVDGIWKNKPLEIYRDSNPRLSANLDANYKHIINSTYRLVRLTASTSVLELNYSQGDYFIITGVSSTVNPQCVVNLVYNDLPDNSSIIYMIELRQNTGIILIGGLENVKYEDGRPIQLSGTNKTDLLTITIQKLNNTVTTYVTANALNLAQEGQGGQLANNRYDKFRYQDIQLFDTPNLYDDYFKYVQLLLNFEPQQATNKSWIEDKSSYSHTITTDSIQKATDIYTFGIREYIAEFSSVNQYIDISNINTVLLDSDFTLEFFIKYPDISYFKSNTTITHNYILDSNNNFNLYYVGKIDTRQDTKLIFKLGSSTYTYLNAFQSFKGLENRYIHIAVVRKGTEVLLFIDGVYQNPVEDSIDNPVTSIELDEASINVKGELNSFRLSKYARYYNNFTIPAMRFGLIGGYENILEKFIFDLYPNISTTPNYVADCMFI